MEPTELRRIVGAHLDHCGCARCVTGSVASTLFGEPRFTNDLDIVVRMDARQAAKFAAGFSGDDWYAGVEAMAHAAQRRGP